MLSLPHSLYLHIGCHGFVLCQEAFNQFKTTKADKVLNERLFKAKFHLSDQAFADGLDAGDWIRSTDADGNSGITWKSGSHEHVRGKDHRPAIFLECLQAHCYSQLSHASASLQI